MNFQISVSDSSLVVRMDASQAFDPGSSPGYRKKHFFDINQGFISRLTHRIYSPYAYTDFILLKFMFLRELFREEKNTIVILKGIILLKDKLKMTMKA